MSALIYVMTLLKKKLKALQKKLKITISFPHQKKFVINLMSMSLDKQALKKL